MQDVIYIFQIMLLEFAWQVLHELPIPYGGLFSWGANFRSFRS